ncbi:MAG TPA: DUF2064 domain-containing protein, partial [Candidatus Angelobacter sp.]|nr:DUF2064 domain-containing protein [Candidatus Angelobacter sp.]
AYGLQVTERIALCANEKLRVGLHHDGIRNVDSGNDGAINAIVARIALKNADAVLGPTADGGFYLIGLKDCPVGVLEGIQ